MVLFLRGIAQLYEGQVLAKQRTDALGEREMSLVVQT
jgi:hypothetical protein